MVDLYIKGKEYCSDIEAYKVTLINGIQVYVLDLNEVNFILIPDMNKELDNL